MCESGFNTAGERHGMGNQALTRNRNGMCESGFNTAEERHGMCKSGFNTAWERHGMCESAFRDFTLTKFVAVIKNNVLTPPCPHPLIYTSLSPLQTQASPNFGAM